MTMDDKNKTVFRPSPLRAQPPSGGAVPGMGGPADPSGFAPPAPGFAPPPPPAAPLFGDTPGDPFGAMPAAPAAPADPFAPPVSARLTNPALQPVTFSDTVPKPAEPPRERNPMMASAEPVLAMAAAIQSGRWHVSLPDFHARAVDAISRFESAIHALYPEPVRQRAKYAVCATLDDIAQNLPGNPDGGTGWAQRNMVVTFFRENLGGDRYWTFVQEMLADPRNNRDLIELFHACLAAGFEGRTREMADGRQRKQEVMASLLGALENSRDLSRHELVDHWKGEDRPRQPVHFWSIIMLAAAAAAGIAFMVYLLFFVVLMFTGDDPDTKVQDLFPSDPVVLNRAATPFIAPAPPLELRLRQFLAAEIAQGLVEVQGNRVRTTVGTLFDPASDQLIAERLPLFEKIGEAIALEKGAVTVEGHADSDKISASIRFPNNMALSQARAQTVAQIIAGKLNDPARVTAVGKGDTMPLASNDTAAGKAQNRRVEIVVEGVS